MLGLAYLAGNGLAGLAIVFFATFPFENQSPEDRAARHWLIPVAPVLFLLALLVLIALVRRQQHRAFAAYVANAAVGFALLAWALRVSEHSDQRLWVSALAVEIAGLAAVAFAADGRPPQPGSSGTHL